jgi:membrane protease YdiL (CAAX protease family)
VCRNDSDLTVSLEIRVRASLLKSLAFVAVAMAGLAATAPLVGIAAAMVSTSGMSGQSNVPMWLYAGAFSMTLAAITWAALVLDRTGFHSLGLVPTRVRVGELLFGFVLSVVLFAELALVRGASVGAGWTFAGSDAVAGACAGIIIAFLLFFPEELLFRGYAFQRLVKAFGAWPAIWTSSALFGVYHVVGSGMWGIGAFFTFAMPALGGVVLGWAAVRSHGLALPIGLHLGGNWVQASVFSFQLRGDASSAALWTASLTETQAQTLYAPELVTHLPFIVAMLIAAIAVRWTSGRNQEFECVTCRSR